MAAAGEDVLVRSLSFLTVLAALALAACGGGGDETSFDISTSQAPEQQVVLQAGQQTHAAKSGRVSFKVSVKGGATSGTMTGQGVFSQRRFHLTMDLGDLAGLGGGEAELVFENPAIYMKLPSASAAELPPGKEWLKLDLGKLGETQGLDLSQLLQLNQSDPSQALDFLQGASDDFRKVGTDEVRGAPATHYGGTIDLQQVANEAPAEVREQYERLFQLNGQKTVPMDVWIGDDGFVRKVSFTQQVPNGGSMLIEEEFYDFGTDEQVTTPPSDEVLDITALLGNS
jgi:hypothetical protein